MTEFLVKRFVKNYEEIKKIAGFFIFSEKSVEKQGKIWYNNINMIFICRGRYDYDL